MKGLKFALRLLLRDWRAGELRVLAFALVIAVGSMTSVGFFTDRIHGAMQQQTGELLGGDLVITSTSVPERIWQERATELGLRSVVTLGFPSVVLAGDRTRLIEVKAVGDGYPLRGRLRVALAAYGEETEADGIPERGTVWLDAQALEGLGLVVGDSLSLGSANLRVTRVLTYEPDRGGSFFSIAPRLLLNMADMEDTRLLGPASRVSYRLLLAGQRDTLAAYRARLAPTLRPGQRFLDVSDARPELETALERARRFLGLAALLSVVLAGVAVATATRRYVMRHLDSSALMRCFGATQATIIRLFGIQMLVLGVVASLTGCLLGFVAQEVLAQLLAGLIAGSLPPPSLWPVVVGVLAGLITLTGFSLPELMRLKHVPPQRVLRRDIGPLPARSISLYGAVFLSMGALLLWQAGDVVLAAWVVAGIAATLILLALAAMVLVNSLDLLRGRVGVAWRYGIANVARRSQSSVTQVVAFGVGIMALLLLSLVRSDLLVAWQKTLPPDAPNQFLINILPEQVTALQRFFAEHKTPSAVGSAPVVVHPMIRARLAAVNGRPVAPEDYSDDRARRLVEREFNLSWSDTLSADNRIVAGKWWGVTGRGRHELSVELGLAQSLGLKLGDELVYRIADREVRATITSLRRVAWDSFRANFFVVMPPGVLEEYPATYITSYYLPAGERGMSSALVRQFPNVTVIDIDAVMVRVRDIMQRVNLSVEYVFLFTLLAGLSVLYAAIQSTRDERVYESALLRTLGASRRQLLAGLIAEFVILGLIAGALAALAASVAGHIIAGQVFRLAYSSGPWLWVAGILGGALCIGVFGVWGTRFTLNQPPLRVLREL